MLLPIVWITLATFGSLPPSAVPLVPDLEHWQFPVLTVLTVFTAFATCWTVFHGRKDRDLPE